MALQLLTDGSARGFVVAKALPLNLNFGFLNRISLLLISSSYPIVLTRLCGPFETLHLQKNFKGRVGD